MLLALLMLIVLGATLTGCSDDGDPVADGGADTTAASDDGDDGSDEGDDGDGDDGDDGDASSADCEDLVSLEEASELFGAEAQFSTEGDMGEIGGATLSCVYETPPSDDLESVDHLLQVRVWPGEQYYDPDLIEPDHEDLADLGDDAFVEATGSVDAGYIEGDTVVFISYTVIDLSASEPQAPAKKDDVVAMLRTIHERMG
jgi:hypothetical protein